MENTDGRLNLRTYTTFRGTIDFSSILQNFTSSKACERIQLAFGKSVPGTGRGKCFKSKARE
jgi:hypothetical protein